MYREQITLARVKLFANADVLSIKLWSEESAKLQEVFCEVGSRCNGG
jgi:hypothetical protein